MEVSTELECANCFVTLPAAKFTTDDTIEKILLENSEERLIQSPCCYNCLENLTETHTANAKIQTEPLTKEALQEMLAAL